VNITHVAVLLFVLAVCSSVFNWGLWIAIALWIAAIVWGGATVLIVALADTWRR